MELMEERQLMAGDINLIDGVLRIDGTDGDDQVVVQQYNRLQWGSGRRLLRIPMIRATVNDVTERFPVGDVNELQVVLGDGDDVFTNNTNKPSMVWGEGDDDTLRGGSNVDQLFGGPGNDNLYGRAGDDDLRGGSGRDGLFGGRGVDDVQGGSGSDRFLIDTNSPDNIIDARAIDAEIFFNPGGEVSEGELYGRNGRNIFEAGAWRDHEIELIDTALEELHDKTRNDHLLERYNNEPLNFIRHGRVTDLYGNTPMVLFEDADGNFTAERKYVGGYNDDDAGIIALTNDAFEVGDRFVRQAVFHEIGHNFDERHENIRVGRYGMIDAFRSLSGWDYQSTGEETTRGQALSGDEKWAHNANANFVRSYGQTNPLEDFATAFAAYFMGSDYGFDGAHAAAGVTDGRELAPNKFAVLDQMFDMWS